LIEVKARKARAGDFCPRPDRQEASVPTANASISTMSQPLPHEALAHVTSVPARSFLDALAATFDSVPRRIQIACDPALRLSADELEPLRAIAGEAIANALAHAFPAGREGRIWVGLAEVEGRITLTVRDNGIGMPDLPPDAARGRGRIDALARQLGGYARLGSAPFGGALVSVVFPRTA
jgi:two-component sensor histidine kinase